MAEPIICRNCHGENPPGSKYCVHCSFSLEWESDAEPETAADAHPTETASERADPLAAVSDGSAAAEDTRPLRPVTPPKIGGRGLIVVAIVIAVIAAVIIVALRGTGSSGSDEGSGSGPPPGDASASGAVAGTVVNGGGVNVRAAPRGVKVGHLTAGAEITATCQSEVNGLRWLKLRTPSEHTGRWIVRDLRPIGGHVVVELSSGDPAACS